jgi:hypothetical protein
MRRLFDYSQRVTGATCLTTDPSASLPAQIAPVRLFQAIAAQWPAAISTVLGLLSTHCLMLSHHFIHLVLIVCCNVFTCSCGIRMMATRVSLSSCSN